MDIPFDTYGARNKLLVAPLKLSVILRDFRPEVKEES